MIIQISDTQINFLFDDGGQNILFSNNEPIDTKCKAFNDSTRDADYVPFSNWAWVQCRGNVWCLNIRIPYIEREDSEE